MGSWPVTIIVRGNELMAPKGNTVLTPGDHLYVFTRPEDRAMIQLMLGRPESSTSCAARRSQPE